MTNGGGFRPPVPPPVWSTIHLLLQKVTSPRFTTLNISRAQAGAVYAFGRGGGRLGVADLENQLAPVRGAQFWHKDTIRPSVSLCHTVQHGRSVATRRAAKMQSTGLARTLGQLQQPLIGILGQPAGPAGKFWAHPSERGVRLAQKTQVGPCIPAGMQL